jgi:hypothetical protein
VNRTALTTALALALAACAGAPDDGTTPMPAAEVEAIRAAWLGAGHLPPTCDAPTISTVDFATFAAMCERPSCADPTVTRDTPVCAHACTLIAWEAPSTLYWAGEATEASGRDWEPASVVWAHETMHAWRDCTYGEPDYNHLHEETWITAMDLFREAQ